MSETKTVQESLPNQFELTPKTALELNDAVAAQEFHLWGHGTASDSAESFFTKGINMGGAFGDSSYSEVMNIALPVAVYDRKNPDADGQITNTDFMRDWPHKKWSRQPNVVLMAMPNGRWEDGSDSNVSAVALGQHVFEDVEGETAFPPQLIVGFLDATNGKVTLNPELELTPDVREKYLHRAVTSRKAAAAALDFFELEGEPLPPIELWAGDDGDAPDVW